MWLYLSNVNPIGIICKWTYNVSLFAVHNSQLSLCLFPVYLTLLQAQIMSKKARIQKGDNNTVIPVLSRSGTMVL